MRKQKQTMLSLLLALITLCLVSPVNYAKDVKTKEKETELKIHLTQPSTTEDSDSSGGSESTESGGGGGGGASSSDEKKDKLPSTYTPAKATAVQKLPQTGEIVTSFVVIILGLSLLMFTCGILINKRVSEDYIEMELYL